MTSIPHQLKESLQKGLAIPFIGAGVSMSVKDKDGNALLPSWKNLLKQAVTRLEAEHKQAEANIVKGYVEINRLLDAAKEAKQALAANWFDFLKQQFDHSEKEVAQDSLQLARTAWQLGSKLIITSNYDHVLRWACPHVHDLEQWDIEAPVEQRELLRNGVNKPTVWHLHGRIDNAADIILTPDGYSKLYAEGTSEHKYQAALKTLQSQLSSRNFIFIGFSLADEDFVRQIQSLADIFQGATGPHYVLLPEAQRDHFKKPADCIEPIYFADFGAPQLALLNELAALAPQPDIISRSGEVVEYNPAKWVFSVPFASKGEQMIGRQAALEQVHRQLHSGLRTAIGQTAAFQGLGGLGKTQLAVEYAYAYQKDYANGVIWINADQDLNVQLIQLAEKSWVSPVADQAFKLTTATKRLREVPDCLIIFDNLENLEAIKEILPAANVSSHILVTSRFEQAGFVAVPLNTLSPEQGLQLLLQEAGRQPQNSDENQAAASIVQQLGGLPLALELAGAYLRRRSTVSWQQYLALLHKNLPAAFLGSHASWTKHEADIYSTLKIHESLFNEEPLLKPLLNALTWSGSTAMSESLLCALLAESEPTHLIGALSLGCALRILQKADDNDAYAVHRLVREVRRAELPLTASPEWVVSCTERLSEWFEKHRRDFSDLALFEANFDHLPDWQQNAHTLGLPLPSARLLWLQAYPAWHWGRYREAQQLLEQAQVLSAQSLTADIALKAHLLNDLGSIKHVLGDSKAALTLTEEALNLRLSLFGEEHLDTALSLNNIASYYSALGKPAQALELGEQALQICRALFGEQHPDTANSLNNVASYYHALGQPAKALELGEQALQIRRTLFGEENPNTASSLGNVALYYNVLGNPAQALEIGKQALQIRRILFGEEHPDTALSLNNVASYYDTLRKPAQALELGEQALQIRRTLFGAQHPDTANSLHNVASYYYALGKIANALELGKQAWFVRQKLFGDVHPETVLSNHNLIVYLIANKQRPEALTRLDMQLSLLKKDHPYYEDLQRLRVQLLSQPIRPGFRQQAKSPGKNKPKKRR